MFIFNFIGLAFAMFGCMGAFLLTWPASGMFQDYLFPAILGGAFVASALDLRYRWIGEETPAAEPVEPVEGSKTMAGYIGECIGATCSFGFKLVWPWSGGQILFIPIWLALPAVIALDATGWLGFLHSAPKV